MASSISRQSRRPTDYTIACVCPMSVELAPVEAMLDETHEPLPIQRDRNAYTLGSIGGHNIVIAVMPEIGSNAAAATVTHLLNDFPAVRFGLLVGIGGGVPGDSDVRLGDVVVGQPTGAFPGVVQYDMKKELDGGQFQRIGSLNKPPTVLSANVRKLDSQHRRLGHNLLGHISAMLDKWPMMQLKYSFLTLAGQDHLFLNTYKHQSGSTCDKCDHRYIIPRPDRPDQEPRIHYGTIGSANKVIKDAEQRDMIRADTNALCIEMEAAGLMSDFPCLVIRGICDYADSHKNKRWQPYAAATAAAYMKALLLIIPVQEVSVTNHAAESTMSPFNVYSEGENTDKTPERHKMGQAQAGSMQASNQTTRSDRADAMERYTNLHKSLLFDRMKLRVNSTKRGLPSTCEWLIHHTDFQNWYNGLVSNEHNGFFWIKGKPGCGKSTLMKTVLGWAQKQKVGRRRRQTIVPYFFNARASTSLEKSALGLYRTVVYHLLSSYEFLRPLYMDKFDLKDLESSEQSWSIEELQEFLYDVVESKNAFEICLIIDALDEAEYDDDVRQMLDFLIQLSDRASGAHGLCRLQICLSSRHYPHVSIRRGLSLIVEEQPGQGRDIETYIHKQLTCTDGPLRDELQAKILRKSARIFLWVVLVVKILNELDDQGYPLSDMHARLETIPAGLSELFKEILLRSDHRIETSVLLFQWTVFSRRALEPAELYMAMEYSRSPDESAWTAPTQIVPPDRLGRYILDCSRGLVEVVPAEAGQTSVVQFIHETVREFLLEANGLASIVPALAANLIGISHEILRVACFRCIKLMNRIPDDYKEYLTNVHGTNDDLKKFKSEMRLKFPFLDYAVSHLFEHAEQAQRHNISQQAFLNTQIDERGIWVGSYPLWWNILQRYKSGKVRADKALFCFIAEKQFVYLTHTLFILPGIHIGCRTALQQELRKRNVQLANNIVEMGMDFDAERKSSNSLQETLYNSHIEMLQMLVKAGEDVIAQGKCLGGVLRAASLGGHEKVVQMLIQAGADVNAGGGLSGNALYAASERGHEKVVQILIQAGADVNAGGGLHGNALHAASEFGHKKVVQMLIQAGVDVNAGGGLHGNALHAASEFGHEKVVQMLIQAGADVNAGGGLHGNALHAASERGREKVVQMLIQAGADLVEKRKGEQE